MSGPYTGDFCPDCGSDKMIRTGTCVTCQDCGSNTGCGRIVGLRVFDHVLSRSEMEKFRTGALR